MPNTYLRHIKYQHIYIYSNLYIYYMVKKLRSWNFLAELAAGVGLAEGPAGRSGVEGDDGPAIAGDYSEGEALAVEVGVALPVLAPVS